MQRQATEHSNQPKHNKSASDELLPQARLAVGRQPASKKSAASSFILKQLTKSSRDLVATHRKFYSSQNAQAYLARSDAVAQTADRKLRAKLNPAPAFEHYFQTERSQIQKKKPEPSRVSDPSDPRLLSSSLSYFSTPSSLGPLAAALPMHELIRSSTVSREF